MFSRSAAQTPEQANFYHLVMDIAWFGLGLAASSRFLSVYAIKLGANEFQLSLMTALPAIVLLLSSSIGLHWRARYPDSAKAVFWPSFGFRLVFLLPALTPFLPREWQPLGLIAFVTVPALAQGIASVVFFSLLRESVETPRITALTSRRALALNVTLAIGALGFGYWLEIIPFPLNYQAMFVAAFILTCISLWHVGRVQPLPQILAVTRPLTPEYKVNPWKSAGFQRVALLVALSYGAFFSVFALTPMHLVNGLGAEEGFMAIFSLTELGAGAFISLFTRRIVDRIGNRNMVGLAMMGTGIGVSIIAFAPSLTVTLIGAFFIGAAWITITEIGVFGFFTENTPPEDATPYSQAYFQVISLSIFLGPLIGSLLTEFGLNLVAVLLVGAALRIGAGMAIFLIRAKMPARTMQPTPEALIWHDVEDVPVTAEKVAI